MSVSDIEKVVDDVARGFGCRSQVFEHAVLEGCEHELDRARRLGLEVHGFPDPVREAPEVAAPLHAPRPQQSRYRRNRFAEQCRIGDDRLGHHRRQLDPVVCAQHLGSSHQRVSLAATVTEIRGSLERQIRSMPPERHDVAGVNFVQPSGWADQLSPLKLAATTVDGQRIRRYTPIQDPQIPFDRHRSSSQLGHRHPMASNDSVEQRGRERHKFPHAHEPRISQHHVVEQLSIHLGRHRTVQLGQFFQKVTP